MLKIHVIVTIGIKHPTNPEHRTGNALHSRRYKCPKNITWAGAIYGDVQTLETLEVGINICQSQIYEHMKLITLSPTFSVTATWRAEGRDTEHIQSFDPKDGIK